MRPATRSIWLKAIVLSSLVLFVAQCGDESDVVIEDELDCLIEGFQGGEYYFTVNKDKIDDGCAEGYFNDQINAGPYGPATLPAAPALSETVDVTITLPFVGNVRGTLSRSPDGKVLTLTVPDPIQVVGIVLPFYGAVTVTAAVSGTLCPVSQEEVEARFTITVQDVAPPVPLIETPCVVGVPATGMSQ